LAAACLASAVLSGVALYQVTRDGDGGGPGPGTAAEGTVSRDEAERRVLRAEAARVGRAVGLVATIPPAPTGGAEKRGAAAPLPMPIPDSARISKDDVAAKHRTSRPDPRKTSEVTLALEVRFKEEVFASSQIAFDEVDCRGPTCRVRVSYAEDVPVDPIVAELARVFPDGTSFQEQVEAGDRRRPLVAGCVRPRPSRT
jgi:hypothetical protein